MNLRISNPQERHFDSATLTALARRHATIPLRRAGALTELLIVGIADCLAGQPDLPTLVLAGSQNGALAAGMRLLSCIEIDHEEPYPFDFLASQPIIAAVALQKSFPCIENTLYQPWHGNAELHRQRAHTLAAAWLRAGRCARVLCGQVEPNNFGKNPHFGRWQRLEI